MKVLEKTVELGEKSFKVRTNKDIAVASFEKFPEVLEYMMKQQKPGSQDFITMIKNKELSKLFRFNDDVGKLVEFALPLMLEASGDTSDAKEIIKYAKNNGVIEQFNTAMLEFIGQGFTLGELAQKPKIKFSMK